VQVEGLAVLLVDAVDDGLVVGRTERRADERLSLATREEHGSMLARDEVRDDRDRTDLVVLATVDTGSTEDRLTFDGLLDLLEEALDLFGETAVVRSVGGQSGDALLLDLADGGRALVLALGGGGGDDAVLVLEGPVTQLRVHLGGDEDLLRLAGLGLQLVNELDDVLDDPVGHGQRVDHVALGELLGGGLDHGDAVLVAGDDEVEVAVLATSLVSGPGDELTVDRADAHRAEAGLEGQAADTHGREGRDHCQDVRVVLAVVGQNVAHHLDFGLVAVGEHRPDRAVDQAHGQDLFGRRATFALEEAAGDLARGLGLLAVVADEREEVDVLPCVAGRRSREHHRLAEGRNDRAAGLTRDLSRFQFDALAADDGFHACGFSTHFLFVSCCLFFACQCRTVLSGGPLGSSPGSPAGVSPVGTRDPSQAVRPTIECGPCVGTVPENPVGMALRARRSPRHPRGVLRRPISGPQGLIVN